MVVPKGPPMMRRRQLMELGLSRHEIIKMEDSGVLHRVHPIPGGHGYYLRDEVRKAIEGE